MTKWRWRYSNKSSLWVYISHHIEKSTQNILLSSQKCISLNIMVFHINKSSTAYIPCTNTLRQVTSVNYCILTDLIYAYLWMIGLLIGDNRLEHWRFHQILYCDYCVTVHVITIFCTNCFRWYGWLECLRDCSLQAITSSKHRLLKQKALEDHSLIVQW